MQLLSREFYLTEHQPTGLTIGVYDLELVDNVFGDRFSCAESRRNGQYLFTGLWINYPEEAAAKNEDRT